VGSATDESGRWKSQGVDTRIGEKDCVARGLGELLDGGRNVHGVADQHELELASPTDVDHLNVQPGKTIAVWVDAAKLKHVRLDFGR
jgi:hypothetical protein